MSRASKLKNLDRRHRKHDRSSRRQVTREGEGLRGHAVGTVQDERYPTRELPRRLERLLEAVRNRGHSVHPNSRVAQYVRILDGHLGRTEGLSIPTEIAEHVNARIEAGQLEFIHRMVMQSPELPGWANLMAQVVNGPLLPAAEGNDQPRDHQAQLFAAAAVRRAGFQASLDEPDVVANYRGRRFGIAVKRPRTLAAVKDRIRDGARQLERHGLSGIILLDLTLAFELEQGFWGFDHIDLENPAAAARLVGSDIERQLAARAPNIEIDRMLRESSAGRFVGGIATVAHAAMWDRTTGRMVVLHKWANGPLPGPARAARVFFREFNGRLAR